MSDLIERLRSPTSGNALLCHNAADEIERLRAEIKGLHALCDEWKALVLEFYEPQIERLRAALHSIARNQMEAWGDEFQKGINSQAETALAALEETKGVLDRDE